MATDRGVWRSLGRFRDETHGLVALFARLALGAAAGIRLRATALASAALLALFGIAMAISFGPKEPLDYSVFSACAAALLLAERTRDR